MLFIKSIEFSKILNIKMNNEIEKRKENFIRDLQNKKFDDNYIIQKYLCNGSSPIFDESTIFLIKYNIANKFSIHPNEIILTGSAQLGFSIAPEKELNNFNDNSDIDIAIISNSLFERYWSKLLLFNINVESRTEKEQKNYDKFINYLFRGWIRPDKFPFKFEKKKEWFQFFNELKSKFYKYGEHEFAAGIYKNFTVFELYNKENINRIRNKINAGVFNNGKNRKHKFE